MTYLRTHSGWANAAFILDVFSRLVVGSQVSTTLQPDHALNALDMGLGSLMRSVSLHADSATRRFLPGRGISADARGAREVRNGSVGATGAWI
jgi:transposase InsO family protein